MESPIRWIGITQGPAGLRYGLALAIVVAMALLRWALQPLVGPTPPFITLYFAVMAAAALGGFGPGLLTTALGALLSSSLFNPPQAMQLAGLSEPVRVALFLLGGVGVSAIGGLMHKAQRTAQEEALRCQALSDSLQQANLKLVESHRAKNRFLAVLGHELRNPLMPLRNALYLLEHAPEPGRRVAAREVIHRQVDHLARVVDDLLDITRIENNKIELQRAPIDLRTLARDTVGDYLPLFTDKGVQLRLSVPDEPVQVVVDRARLVQVLSNLLNNAIKFTTRGDQVCVDLHVEPPQAVLTVRDTGRGIAQQHLGRIFEAFEQADPLSGHGGLGMGLWLARRLAELHGGTLDATSEGPGHGATLVLRLPLAAG